MKEFDPKREFLFDYITVVAESLQEITALALSIFFCRLGWHSFV